MGCWGGPSTFTALMPRGIVSAAMKPNAPPIRSRITEPCMTPPASLQRPRVGVGPPHQAEGGSDDPRLRTSGLQSRSDHLKREMAIRLVRIDIAGVGRPIR